MIKISASLVKDFLTCEMRAYYRATFVKQTDKFPEAELGTLIHRAIQRNPRGSYNELYDSILSESKSLSETNLKKLRRCLTNYTKSFSTLISNTSKLEYRFEYTFGGGRIVGIFDYLDNNVVMDWKTSEKLPTERELTDDVQFNMYYNSAKHLLHRDDVKLYLVSLSKNKMLEFKPDKERVDYIFDTIVPKIASTSGNLEEFKLKRGLFTGACKNCQYYKLCRGNDG